TDGNRDAQLFLDLTADFFGNAHSISEQAAAPRNIQPTFIKAKGFNLISVILKNFSYKTTVAYILAIMRGNNNQVFTSLLSLPYSHPGFDTHFFGRIACGEYDAMPCLGITTHSNSLAAILRVLLCL